MTRLLALAAIAVALIMLAWRTRAADERQEPYAEPDDGILPWEEVRR